MVKGRTIKPDGIFADGAGMSITKSKHVSIGPERNTKWKKLTYKLTFMDSDKKLADMIADWARKGAELGVDHGKMCNECAFKTGSVAQAESHNVAAAANCLAYYGQFNCHKNGFENAGNPCSGFLYAKEYNDYREKNLSL